MKVKIPKRFRKPLLRRFPAKMKEEWKYLYGYRITVPCPLCEEYYECDQCPFGEPPVCMKWIREKAPELYASTCFHTDALTIYDFEKYKRGRRKLMRLIEWV